ncbi:MAG: carboxypeptidase regulatory-like domain-containing protein [Candidatus Sulfotelmatobacter sp.]|jgi:carboxypeptidase family protein
MDLLGRWVRRVAFFALFLGVFSGIFQRVEAQVAGATISGSVKDPSGAAVSGAQVSITDAATGILHAATTDSSGFYSVPNLLPGKYDVKVLKDGFAPALVEGITLSVGAQQSVNLALAVGTATERVQVDSAAPTVELNTSAMTSEVDGNEIRELPLNGRDWAQLATLEPGVNAVRNQSPVGGVSTGDVVRALRGFGDQLSISGARPQQNNYRLDGISINDYTNGAPGGVLGSLSGVDGIQEFSVITTNYSAEYGRTSGGVINAISRSGTNQFHGSAYEFIRNSALDARNYFDIGPTGAPDKPPFRRNQFGGSVGGPIVKDKTFWFFNYEGLRQSLTATQLDEVPSASARSTADASITPYLAFWPSPNGALNGQTGQYFVATLQQGNENFFTGRIDHKLSDQDSLAGNFGYDKTRLEEPDPLNNLHFLDGNSRPFFAIEETHTFNSSLVNALRFGFNRNRALSTTADPINPLASSLSLGVVPGSPAPEIQVGDGSITNFDGGIGGFPNFEFGWNSFQLYNDAFLTHGAHSIKFGFALERMQSNNFLHFSDNGGYVFSSLSAFLADTPQVFFSTVPGTATERGIRETLFGGYVQDDWRARSNVTVNLGLRYEATNVPTEVNGKLAVLRNPTDSFVHTGNPYFNNPTLRNFEPRVGLAWDPFHNGKTAVRSGFGFYDVLPLPYEFVILSSASAPFAANVAAVNPGPLPTSASTVLGTYSPGSLANQRVSYIQPNPARSYVMQWNLNLQQEFTPSVIGTIAYVGSRGVHLPFRTDDSNIVIPTLTSAGYIWPRPVGSGTLLNPNVGQEDRLVTQGDSYYDALQTGLKVKSYHGLQLQSSFTWGKTIDDGSSTIAGDQFSNSPSSLPLWFDPKTRRAQADFNLGKNLMISGDWQVPHSDSLTGPAGWALRGWELGGIFEASTGAPFTVVTGGDPLGMNSTDPWDYPSRVNAAGCGNPINVGNPNAYVKSQCFSFATAPSPAYYSQYCDPSQPYPTCINLLGNSGRNPLNGPGLINTDFSIFKNNSFKWISETANVQFRAEFFNIFNRVNFAPPLDHFAITDPAFGTIDRTQTSSRQIQFGLKILW